VSVTVLFDYQFTNVFVTGAKVLKAMPIGTHAAVMSFVTSPKILHPAGELFELNEILTVARRHSKSL
jgi:hypothetical protein